MITYDDFIKVEIRIGEIRSVEVVEGADKLLRLMVDVGEGVGEDGTPVLRQILSAIRTYFEDPQVLVGQKYPFVTNLEPRTIRGFESHGMILATSHEGTLALLQPSADVPAGTKVK
ncbi:MAG TPA: hypothetical protein VFS75_03860 [Candidatus Paceibacterota bacterium]|nr:hypothetical protein [Candidatus Paceibacterota bacterium]